MSRKCQNRKYNMGLILSSVGIGIILVFVVPVWGWILAGGVGLIYCGWKMMGHHHH